MIPCKPEFKVVEDEMIVGILTESNQFIQIDPPVPVSSITDSIKKLTDSNYLLADVKTSNVSKIHEYDKERVEYIKRIKLESNFYNVFRNTVKIMLNKYESLGAKEKIEKMVADRYTPYKSKLLTISGYISDLLNDAVIFSESYDISLLNDISTCIVLDETKCNSKRPVCAMTTTTTTSSKSKNGGTGNTCQLILPKFNLLTHTDNETHYFGKMADEMIRYNRINSYIFKPKSYLSFGTTQYKLRENEVIVLQSLLTQEYFEKLAITDINKYAKHNSYDSANPKQTQTYDNRVFTSNLLRETISQPLLPPLPLPLPTQPKIRKSKKLVLVMDESVAAAALEPVVEPVAALEPVVEPVAAIEPSIPTKKTIRNKSKNVVTIKKNKTRKIRLVIDE